MGRNAFRGKVSSAVVLIFAAAGVARAQTAPPRPDHVVIVIEENHSFNEIILKPLIEARDQARREAKAARGRPRPRRLEGRPPRPVE